MRKKIEIHKKEALSLLKAWLAISLAFTIILTSPIFNKMTLNDVLINLAIAASTVGLGFLLHELAHKVAAQKYGCEAEFKEDNMMLLLAIGMSFFGFVFAAPGAVYIKGYLTRVQNGIISLAGPLMNLLLALAFLPGLLLFNGTLGLFFLYGFIVNSWLGLFNMIPVGNFDGAKIYKWNKPVYFSTAVILLALTIFAMFMQ